MAKKFRPDVVTWDIIDANNRPPWAERSFHTRNFLAEGDSWFTMGGIPTSNMLFGWKASVRRVESLSQFLGFELQDRTN